MIYACPLKITMLGKEKIQMTAEDRKLNIKHHKVSFQILNSGSLWIQDWSELLATGVDNTVACTLGKHKPSQACWSHRPVSQAPAFNFKVLLPGTKLSICLLQT